MSKSQILIALVALFSLATFGCGEKRELVSEKEIIERCIFILEWSGDGKSHDRIRDELLEIDETCKTYTAKFPGGERLKLIQDLRMDVAKWGQHYKIAAFGVSQGSQYTPAGSSTSIVSTEEVVGRRSAKYRPYSILSTKLGVQMDSVTIERELLCKSSFDNLAFSSKLLADYDLKDTAGDSSMGYVSFAGTSESRPVTVSIFTDHQERIVKYIAIDGDTVVTCEK